MFGETVQNEAGLYQLLLYRTECEKSNFAIQIVGDWSMNKYVLEMKDITKEFPGVKALNHVNIQVKEGEIHALVGKEILYTL